MFRPRLGDAQIPDAIKVVILDGDLPAPPRLIRFLGDDVFHDLLPRPRPELRVRAVHVHASEGEIEMRLRLRLVVSLEQTLRLGPVSGFETRLLAGDFVFEIENTPGALDQTELLLHCFTHGFECEAVGPFAVSEQWASVDGAVSEY